MYDLSSMTISDNFDTALRHRDAQSNLNMIPCAGPPNEKWQFDESEGITSIVTDVRRTCEMRINQSTHKKICFQWDLVCERLPLLSTVQGSYMGGVFVGCIVFGWASDK